MRIIDHIDHPNFKISIFDSHDKLSLQIEDGLVAITLKFRKDSVVSGPKQIRKLLEGKNYQDIDGILSELRKIRSDRIKEAYPPADDDFDPII